VPFLILNIESTISIFSGFKIRSLGGEEGHFGGLKLVLEKIELALHPARIKR